MVGSPTHTGSGALKFYGVNGNCPEAIYRNDFDASIGEYSAWVNQTHVQAGFAFYVQTQLTGENLFGKDHYWVGCHASNGQPPSGIWLGKRRDDVQEVLRFKTPSSFVLGEWVRAFIKIEPGGVITAGYQRQNGDLDTIMYVDPDPLTAPGKFIIMACADVYPTAHFFDDVCFNPCDHDGRHLRRR